MPPRRRRRGLELGLILLLNELLQFGMRNIPPVTLGTILGQTLLYMGIINVPWEKEEVCISGNAVLRDSDWRRLILSALEHGDDMHLYFNMASFLIKGRSLERRYGSRNFGVILLFLTVVTSIMYVTLAHVMTSIMESEYYMESCAIGFSGVIFALKVLTTHEEPYIRAMLLGIEIPGKYAAWVELIVIHMLVPNSSFMGHFAGILAGVIYCKTCIGTLLDKLITVFTGARVVHGGDVFVVITPCGETTYTNNASPPKAFERNANRSWNSRQYNGNRGSIYGSAYGGLGSSQNKFNNSADCGLNSSLYNRSINGSTYNSSGGSMYGSTSTGLASNRPRFNNGAGPGWSSSLYSEAEGSNYASDGTDASPYGQFNSECDLESYSTWEDYIPFDDEYDF